MLEFLLGLAIVTQDQIPLRAAPQDNAAQHALLTQGDHLEVRGEKGDYLQVYDHRRERAGYIRLTQASRYTLKAGDAPQLKAVLTFLQNQPGYEAMGIGHVAAFLRAAPAEAIDAEALAALGRMADRLAWRASRYSGADSANAQRVSRHLDLAAYYGVKFYSVEHGDRVTLCYDGDAWRHVLALPATPTQQAEAALALTRHECAVEAKTPGARLAADQQRAELIDDALAAGERQGGLPEHLKNRLKIRSAGLWAGIAFRQARSPEAKAETVFAAGQLAETRLASVNPHAFFDGDRAAWNAAAIRVGASRWAAQPQQPFPSPPPGRPGLKIVAGSEPGQTCVEAFLTPEAAPKTAPKASGRKQAAAMSKPSAPLVQCTYGQVWTSSLRVSPDGQLMTLAVQPLADWRELWIFRRDKAGWQLDVAPPAADRAEAGYVEFAGWVPGNKQLLAARETLRDGRGKTSFEVWSRATLNVERSADKPGNLSVFYRWQDPVWKGGSVALR